ncbi:MAG TPA: universal stress protein, partial [Nitrososphaeraceae archaeon]|nr:universal stress protein [Nitrososphaeraceae archaeon]
MSNAMRNFSKILVAIDGSEISMKAAVCAIDMAKKDNSQMIALTVLDISTPRRVSSSFITAPTYGLKELEEKRKESQQWLDKFEKLAAKENSTTNNNNNIQYKSEIIEDSTSRVGSAIVDYAERENVDLIVIGTRGRTG